MYKFLICYTWLIIRFFVCRVSMDSLQNGANPGVVTGSQQPVSVEPAGGGGPNGGPNGAGGGSQNGSSGSGRSTPSSDSSPGKLFVGGLSWQTTPEKLREYFGQFGNVTDVLVMKDPVTQVSFLFQSHEKYKTNEYYVIQGVNLT